MEMPVWLKPVCNYNLSPLAEATAMKKTFCYCRHIYVTDR